MKTYPLHSISLEQAKQLQFKVIDAVTRNFQGEEVLSLGDLGVVKGLNKPRCTVKVEKVFADTFDAPAALLVRGSGTGAIRWALTACLKPGDAILVHTSPIYTTTQVTIDAMGLKPIRADFNDLEQLKAVCAQHKDEIRGALVQLTRQKPEDRYDYKAVIAAIKAALPGIPVVTDDNYAALKVDAIGYQAGADLSTFSCFKILGPEGVGAVIGSKELIDRIYKMQYSGGSQVQGHEAMEALRGLIYAPVALAIQSEVNEELVRRLSAEKAAAVAGKVGEDAIVIAADTVVALEGAVLGKPADELDAFCPEVRRSAASGGQREQIRVCPHDLPCQWNVPCAGPDH